VLLFLVVGVVLRAVLLWRPITYDEAFTYTYYASRPLHVIVSDYSYPNNHIFHTILVKLFTKVFGVGLISLRLPAFLAGVVALPVFYLFVRAMFNRYIALLAMAMACASGPLLGYSACARGYSLTWLFMVLALLLGRDLVKKDRTTAAVLLGICCALGMWTIPSFAYIAGMIHIWLVVSLMSRYEDSLNGRLLNVVLSGCVFVAVTFLFYLPVILVHGVGQIIAHDTYGITARDVFYRTHQDRALELWAMLVDSTALWIVLLGIVGLLYSAYTSSKYRALLLGLFFGAVPLVIFQAVVAPPRVWLYSVFIFHIGSAIAVYYLLKFVQDRLLPEGGKRQRTAVASVVLLVIFGWTGLREQGQGGMPEAEVCAREAVNTLKAGDKLYAQFPWDSPIEFHLLAMGADRRLMYGECKPGHTILAAVGPESDQTLTSVLAQNRVPPGAVASFRLIQDSPRLKIFAAP
jgi:4-amino-4-deoxy-L-arabinose transferase-like glycosyltransferase